jgi:hypothetical protein
MKLQASRKIVVRSANAVDALIGHQKAAQV